MIEDEVVYNDLDEEVEDYLIWEESHKTDSLCIFCKKIMYVSDDTYKDYVIKCLDCPYSYHEVSYTYDFYGFKIDKYNISATTSDDYEGNDFIRITIGDTEIGSPHKIPQDYWVCSDEEKIEKIKTLMVFR